MRLKAIVLIFSIAVSLTCAAQAVEEDRLAAQVTVRRDTFGVPHILAPTEEAVALGQGYVTAEDHLLAVARLILKARSEESAQFGEEFAESDLAIKELEIHPRAASAFRQMPPWLQRVIEAYAAGYNRYIRQHRSELPEWVRPASAVDILAHCRRVMLMVFSMDLNQLRRIGAPPAKRAAATATGMDENRGSNMWAIAPSRSASGKALLLGNPHLMWYGANLFHEMHITVPGVLNFSGTTLIGLPGLAIGFNDHLGWSHTVNAHDSDDVYELEVDTADKSRYRYDGRWLPLEKKEISIQVKTPGGLQLRRKEVYWSHYGPVLKWHQDKAYAFKSANLDEFGFVEQWNRMAKARSLQEFQQILEMNALPMFNIAYADRLGNILYLFNGRFPYRPAGYDWSGVVPGNTSATEWSHILPQSRLPQLLNPAGGYVQNCNSSPWYTTLRQILDRTQFPDYLTPNFNDLRSQHSLEMLEADSSISLEEVLQRKFAMKLLLADRVKPDLMLAARGRTIDGINLEAAVQVLEAWDNSVAREARGAVLFERFWRKYRDAAKPVFQAAWNERQPAATPYGIGDASAALRSLAAAAEEVRKLYGALDVPWGETHRLRRGSIDVPIGGFGGDFGAFRVILYEDKKDGKFVANGGDSYVLAVEFTSPPTAWSIVAYSQTDDPRSPHHTDQSLLFAQEKWKRAWFTEADIAANLERSYHP